jgi:hypothetical protein
LRRREPPCPGSPPSSTSRCRRQNARAAAQLLWS